MADQKPLRVPVPAPPGTRYRAYRPRPFGHRTGPTEEGSIHAEITLNEAEFAAEMHNAEETAVRFDASGDFRKSLEGIIEHIRGAKRQACLEAIDHLHEKALEQTPEETGNLKDMSYTDVTDDGAKVVFPGPYAKYQHYNLQFHHPRGGNALFLELPLMTEKDVMLDIIADALRPYMEG